jgi:hypothetical protein
LVVTIGTFMPVSSSADRNRFRMAPVAVAEL